MRRASAREEPYQTVVPSLFFSCSTISDYHQHFPCPTFPPTLFPGHFLCLHSTKPNQLIHCTITLSTSIPHTSLGPFDTHQGLFLVKRSRQNRRLPPTLFPDRKTSHITNQPTKKHLRRCQPQPSLSTPPPLSSLWLSFFPSLTSHPPSAPIVVIHQFTKVHVLVRVPSQQRVF